MIDLAAALQTLVEPVLTLNRFGKCLSLWLSGGHQTHTSIYFLCLVLNILSTLALFIWIMGSTSYFGPPLQKLKTLSDIFSLRVEIVKLWIQLEWQGVACGELSVRLRDQTFLMEYERTGVILSTVQCVISDEIHSLRQICSNNSSKVSCYSRKTEYKCTRVRLFSLSCLKC